MAHRDLVKATGLGVAAAREARETLEELGLIERVGNGKATKYKLSVAEKAA